MRRTVTIAVAFILAGCGSEEGETAYIRAVIDGQVWSAEAIEGEVAYYVEGGDGVWTVASRPIASGNQLFSLVVPLPLETGTFALDGSVARASYSSCPNDQLADCIYWTAISEDPGSLTVERIDPATGLIEGKFNFTGYALGDPEGTDKTFAGGSFRYFAPGAFPPE